MAMKLQKGKISVLHVNFKGAIAAHLDDLTEDIRQEIKKLDECEGRYNLVNGRIDKYIDEKSTAIHLQNDWNDRTLKIFNEISHMLKAKNPELLKVYFNGQSPSNIRSAADKFKTYDHIISLLEMETRTELKEYYQRLCLLRVEGKNLISGKGSKKDAAATGSKELKVVSSAFETQYMRVKLFLKAFYYGTGIDYTQFFLDLSQPKPGRKTKKEPVLKPVKPISTGKIVVPPPVVSPAPADKPKA